MISKCQIEKMSDHKMEYYSLNSKLCRLVQANPCMYDRTSPNYPKKEYVERAWAHVAKEMNDSVGSCKERWRNIRTAFARSINIYKSPTGPNRHKRYYLHEELEFLTKHITPPTTIVRNLTPVDFEENNSTSLQSVDDSDDNSTLQIVIDTPSPPPAVQLENNKERIPISKRNSIESPFVKKPKLLNREDFPNDPIKNDIKDPDSEFLMTLLPEMKEMNARQKISFKTKIFQALREVFDDDKDFPKKIEPMSSAEKKPGVSVTNCSNIPSNSEQYSDPQQLGTSNSLLAPMVFFGQGECCVKQELVSIDVDD